MSKIDKLMRLVNRPPSEAASRIRNWAEVKLDAFYPVGYQAVLAPDKVHDMLARQIPGYSGISLADELGGLQRDIAIHQRTVAQSANLGVFHDGSSSLGEFLYAITRSLRPVHVVETGVAHGVTSCHILGALERNGCGTLNSIDLPPLVAEEVERSVGTLILPRLKTRWTLHRGTSRALLEPLCRKLGSIDLFVHDSLHTTSTMLFEFDTALKYLARPGVIVSDDVGMSRAFGRFVGSSQPAFHAVMSRGENGGQIGVALYI